MSWGTGQVGVEPLRVFCPVLAVIQPDTAGERVSHFVDSREGAVAQQSVTRQPNIYKHICCCESSKAENHTKDKALTRNSIVAAHQDNCRSQEHLRYPYSPVEKQQRIVHSALVYAV